MHVIFLDIDGVIDARRKINYVDSDKLALLVGIAQQTGSRIVISSHWRLVTPLHSSVRAVLRYYGLEVIGSTPVLTPWTPQRPLEILEWLQAYNSQAGALGRPHVTNYVAIDDRDLASEKGGERLTGHFVRTEIKTGLTEAHADEIAALFANADGAADVPGLPAPPERIIADSIPHGTFGEVRLTEAKATPSPTATASSTVAAPPVAAPLTAPLTGEAAVLDVASSGAGAAPLPAQPLAPLRSFTCEIAHTDIWTGYKLACGNGTGRKPRPWIVTTDAAASGGSFRHVASDNERPGSSARRERRLSKENPIAPSTAEICSKLGCVNLNGIVLGRGAFGVVYLGTMTNSDATPVAYHGAHCVV